MRAAPYVLLVSLLVACSGTEESDTHRAAPARPEPTPPVVDDVPEPLPPALPPTIVIGPDTSPEPVPPAAPLVPSAGPTVVTSEHLPTANIAFTLQRYGIVFEVPHTDADTAHSGFTLTQAHSCRLPFQHEYARVANAALPFEALAVHVARNPFCGGGVSTPGVQVRAYVLDSPVEEVAAAIRRGAGAEIANLPNPEPPPEPEVPGEWTGRTSFPGWTSILVRYRRFYGDYGGLAHMDFHVRRVGVRTVVMLLMYVNAPVSGTGDDRDDALEKIITSVRAQT